jgi:aspartyl-tRNA(Asn)/glutamyl-tRNA(Gln) amidotransferase subunit C
MSLTLAEVEHIADLARLELTADEKEQYREQLSAILDYAARLLAVNTSPNLPVDSILPSASSRLRPDVAIAGLDLESLLANAPQVEDGQFRVPPILDFEP